MGEACYFTDLPIKLKSLINNREEGGASSMITSSRGGGVKQWLQVITEGRRGFKNAKYLIT